MEIIYYFNDNSQDSTAVVMSRIRAGHCITEGDRSWPYAYIRFNVITVSFAIG